MNLFFFSLPVFSFEFAAHSNCLPSFYFSFFFVVDSHAMSNQGDCFHLLLPALKVVNLRYRCAEYFTHNFFLHLWIDFLFPFFLQVLIYPCVSLPSIFCPILPLGCITLLSARRSESCNIVAQIKLNSNGNRFYLHFFKLEPYVSTDNQVVCVSARCRSYRNLKYKIGLRKRNIKCGGNLE